MTRAGAGRVRLAIILILCAIPPGTSRGPEPTTTTAGSGDALPGLTITVTHLAP